MKKKLFTGLAVLVFTLALVASTAFAATFDIETIYMVDSNGSTTQQDIFGWDERPWLYFQMPSGAGSQNIVAESWWYNADGVEQYHIYNDSYSNNTTEIWQSMGSANWDSIKSLDGWTVTAAYSATSKGTDGTGSTSYTVTPEPISSILFLTGGATLGFRRFWKKKMSV